MAAGEVTAIRPAAAPLRARSGLLLIVVSVLGLLAFAWPLVVAHGGAGNDSHAADAPWIVALLVPLLLALLAAELSNGALDAKAVAMLGVLAAAGSALRLVSGGLAGFEFVFFLLLPAGRVFGRGFGFLLGTLTLFASALLTGGIGPWLPFQMLAAGWVGLGAACLPGRLRGRAEIVALATYGALAGLAYGVLMNLWFWPFTVADGSGISFDESLGLVTNLRRFWAFHLVTSLGYDIPRAAVNVTLTVAVGSPILAALRRASARASFGATTQFRPSASSASRG